MKNNALEALKQDVKDTVAGMLQDHYKPEDVAGWLQQEIQDYVNSTVYEWEFPDNDIMASQVLSKIGKVEALKVILTVNFDYFMDDIPTGEVIGMLNNDKLLLSELFEALAVVVYYEDIKDREGYKVKDLIALLGGGE